MSTPFTQNRVLLSLRTNSNTCLAVAAALFAALALLGSGGASSALAAGPCDERDSLTLRNANPPTELVVALSAPYDTNKKRPIMWSYWGGRNQRWCEISVANTNNTQVEYRNLASGKCLTAAGPAKNGTPVNQQTCIGSTYQRWAGRDPFKIWEPIKNIATRGCLAVIGTTAKPGALLQIWSCGSGSNQRWAYGYGQ